MEQFQDIDRILIRYIRDEVLSADETVFLQQWLHAAEGRKEMIANIKNETAWMQNGLKTMQQTSHSRIWDKLSTRLEQEGHWSPADSAPVVALGQTASRRRWRYFVAATVLFAAAGATFWVLQQRSRSTTPANISAQPQLAKAADAQPGSNRAVLTLANGRQINLDSTGNGVIASQGNMKVTKLPDGQLAYNKIAEEKPAPPAFNVLSTPRAGQFSLTLPDGSPAWLNNASSLPYPGSLTADSRKVELTAEADVEIAKDA